MFFQQAVDAGWQCDAFQAGKPLPFTGRRSVRQITVEMEFAMRECVDVARGYFGD